MNRSEEVFGESTERNQDAPLQLTQWVHADNTEAPCAAAGMPGVLRCALRESGYRTIAGLLHLKNISRRAAEYAESKSDDVVPAAAGREGFASLTGSARQFQRTLNQLARASVCR